MDERAGPRPDTPQSSRVYARSAGHAELMRDTLTTVLVVLLGVHILVKFAFFALPYRMRRAALDRQYNARTSATSSSDWVLLALTAVLAAVLLWRGVQATGFLGGLWIGATLIQLYFHRFHTPVPADKKAPEPSSPLKEMSYAIQAQPWKPWPELMTLTVIVACCLALIFGGR
jgi:hypothetical protein